MALQRMILVPPELWENRSEAPLPPPVKKTLSSNDHSYNKWTNVRLHQDPYLKTEKQKREPIAIPIVETGDTPESQPSFKTIPRRKRIIGTVVASESESNISDASPVLKHKILHDSTFGVYQDNTDGSFKTGRSNFKYNVFVDGKMYKATPGLWELLTKSRPVKNMVTLQDRQAYKQILLQTNMHRVNYSPTGRIRAKQTLTYASVYTHLHRHKPFEETLFKGRCAICTER
jgi:hypothetical protein